MGVRTRTFLCEEDIDLFVMNESQAPLPEWISISKVDTSEYMKLMGELQTGSVDRLFKISNVLFYVFIGTLISEFFWGRNMIGALQILLSIIGITIGTMLIYIQLGRSSLSTSQLKDMFMMLPRLRKAFMIGAFTFVVLMFVSTMVTVETSETISFVEIMYSSLPIAIAVFNITMVYPLNLLRRYGVKQSQEDQNTTKADINPVHKQGTVEMADITEEDIDQMDEEEFIEEVTDSVPKTMVMDQIASAKSSPMSLQPEEIDILIEQDCLEEYTKKYSSEESSHAEY